MMDTVLFDWDGTLTDTAERAFKAFQKAFTDLGVPLNFDTYVRFYSPNWYDMYAHLGLPQERWQEAEDLWLHHYGYEIPQLLPGGQAALKELASRNYVLGIVTNGSRVRVRREVGALGLTGIFQSVICNEDVLRKKPDPEGLQTAMRHLQKRPESCCYVGDCPEDIEMGKRANVRTVGIPSQYPASHKLPDSCPDYIFNSLEEFRADLSAFAVAFAASPRGR
jgi:HAD superfamily hydrolase (TIGR01509 family)